MKKVNSALRQLPKRIPKPQVPSLVKSVGPSTGEANPPVVPRNSAKGVKQRTNFTVPGVKS